MIIIESIVYKPDNEPGGHEQAGYLRRPLQAANLIAGHGIEHDRKGGNPKRNLNVMDTVTIAQLKMQGCPTGAGILGENIILSGVDLRTLPEGTLLQLGSDAVIGLVALRVPCEQLTALDERMPEDVIGRVGTMCRVVTSGYIKIGDMVQIIAQPVEAHDR